ncbi:MAG: MarR family transcriptional regulator [Alphaproteobacteria bacterium]|nr:MarR family transcriptional regulator [Alphaproteobacteria bacterium]
MPVARAVKPKRRSERVGFAPPAAAPLAAARPPPPVAAYPALAERIAAMRRFNRFYTRLIGVLDRRHLRSPYSLAEVRVLYELAHREGLSAAQLVRELGLDPGYLSRFLAVFVRRGLMRRKRAPGDRRRLVLSLTPAGRRGFVALDRAAAGDIARILGPLSEVEQRRVIAAMATIADLLGGSGS